MIRSAVLYAGVVGLCGCARIASCEMDRIRADVLRYEQQMKPLRDEERRLGRRIQEFEGKIFTNQKAGVDLLRAVLTPATDDYANKLAALKVHSRLIRPHHLRKVAAYQRLAAAYKKLQAAYPKADFEAIRQGLALRQEAMHELAEVELRLARLIRKYKRKRK